ncbi:MAG: DNA/RNA nuclease SfsA [Puniceicoccales bacterium]|jgi:sugar fermentation stimulation protein A|nr:DNA/RNA nuclease SfsA [Puniceicoccales bacterium]
MYKFESPLDMGTIITRPNRFVMYVKKDETTLQCHCPNTGKIGHLPLEGLPCLLSKSYDKKRKTRYTVEAISFNEKKSFVGINQNAVNRYVEYFFKHGFLEKIASNGHNILREQKVGNAKLDFKIDHTYIEVKTPLKFLMLADQGHQCGDRECLTSYDRLVKHMAELVERLRENENAILLTCFVYDAPMFQVPTPTPKNKIIRDAVQRAARSGVKMWQVNMHIDVHSVKLLKYFEITHLFL